MTKFMNICTLYIEYLYSILHSLLSFSLPYSHRYTKATPCLLHAPLIFHAQAFRHMYVLTQRQALVKIFWSITHFHFRQATFSVPWLPLIARQVAGIRWSPVYSAPDHVPGIST